MIFGAASWTGFCAARTLRRSHRLLEELIAALRLMETEIQYNRTGFFELCALLSERFPSEVGKLFHALGRSCREGMDPGETAALTGALELRLPEGAGSCLARLFEGFGACDAEGQLRLIGACRAELEAKAAREQSQLDGRCRVFRLLGVSGGAALTILVI